MKRSCVLAFLILTVGCHAPIGKTHLVNLLEKQEYKIKKGMIDIELLKTFLLVKKCDSLNQMYYASTYLCKVINEVDTLLIYSICKKPSQFLNENYKGASEISNIPTPFLRMNSFYKNLGW